MSDDVIAALPYPIQSSPRTRLSRRSGRTRQPHRREPPVQVFVRDNNVDQALRILKRKMQREGVFKEMRRARFYEKPSEQAARQKSDAVRRLRKQARKQAIRDGLIVVKPKKPIVGGAGRPTSAATTGPGQPSQKPDSP
jgi:small subunit ribosomal protein S21